MKAKCSVYILGLFLATGCTNNLATTNQQLNKHLPSSPEQASISASTSINPRHIYKLSSQEILTRLMLAEMAANRSMPQIALDNYMIVANDTHDPQIARLATEYAIELQASTQALSAATIWADAAPNELQAQLVAVTLFIRSAPNTAKEYLERAFKLKTEDLDQHLLVILSKLSNEGRAALTDLTRQLADQHNQDPAIQLAAAQLYANQLNIKPANKYLAAALQLEPSLTSGIELKAKLIRYELKDDKPALKYLDRQLKEYPNDHKLRMFYVTALLDNDQSSEATPHLELLTKQPDFVGEALILLGEIHLNANQVTKAKDLIFKAVQHPEQSEKAKYFLAQIAEHEENLEEAIKWYASIGEESQYHLSSRLRASFLLSSMGEYLEAITVLREASPTTLSEQKQLLLTEIDILIDSDNLAEAMSSINQALKVLPDDIDFLYARSLVASYLDQSKQAETDLLRILALDSEHANALNALGYILAAQPDRAQEAMGYIEKAMELIPNNPAFMDSMGWLLYKMNKLPESIAMLNDAYKLSEDSEIAAHFGEVLWVAGKKEAALLVWNKALEASPENKALKKTLKRLNVDMLKDSPTEQVKAQQLPTKIKAH